MCLTCSWVINDTDGFCQAAKQCILGLVVLAGKIRLDVFVFSLSPENDLQLSESGSESD